MCIVKKNIIINDHLSLVSLMKKTIDNIKHNRLKILEI